MWHLHKQTHSIKKPTAGLTSSFSLFIHLTVQFPVRGFNLEHPPLTVSGILIFTRSATHTQGKKGPCADSHLHGHSFIIIFLIPHAAANPVQNKAHPSIQLDFIHMAHLKQTTLYKVKTWHKNTRRTSKIFTNNSKTAPQCKLVKITFKVWVIICWDKTSWNEKKRSIQQWFKMSRGRDRSIRPWFSASFWTHPGASSWLPLALLLEHEDGEIHSNKTLPTH